MFGIEGCAAIVTGAGQGNGRAIALGLAKAGARVAIGDINVEMAENTATEIRDTGGEALAFALDVGDRDQCAKCAAAAQQAFGPASILINNAGIIRRVAIDAENYDADWDAVMRTNLDGSMNMVRECRSWTLSR